MYELALFAGAGGGILGGKLLGWRCVCAVEIDQYARRVLMSRQDDGHLPAFPIWDDVRSFDGRPWRGLVDIITGGFPCTDISVAGTGKGLDGEESGLWREMRRIVGEVGPRYVLVENSPALTYRGLEQVLCDLAEMGYDARWGVLGAIHAGAPHRRDRIWIVAHAAALGMPAGFADPPPWKEGLADQFDNGRQDVSDSDHPGLGEQRGGGSDGPEDSSAERGGWWSVEPGVGRMVDGVANRVDRVRCLGNGQAPAVVRLAWSLLSEKSPDAGAIEP